MEFLTALFVSQLELYNFDIINIEEQLNLKRKRNGKYKFFHKRNV